MDDEKQLISHSNLGGVRLTQCAGDSAVEPPWMGEQRVSLRFLVDGASFGYLGF